ncbi:MAG: electron transport complex subunit RsxA [Symbiobacterium thermophilum]|uniref:Ion-translocating oxidoreductase complex subunit A n=1 Tax=Symbiobacterium thermophilum TaxID=2734 RepID=A0A1Y2T5Y6_SYMTR|nr:MAG: electron transport complex subunit RsxA [Symbiobacterium thermophilum]
MEILAILVGGILINNYIFSRFLGLCPFFGVSNKLETVYGMGAAVVFVMTLASAITWPLQHLLLEPLGLGYLQTVAFILVIAALVQTVEMVIQRVSPTLYAALGIFLPLLTTNCAVLGAALLNITQGYGFMTSVLNGFACGIGWTLATLLFAGVRERIEGSHIPPAMRGMPIAFVAAGLMALAFMGFQGLFRGILF